MPGRKAKPPRLWYRADADAWIIFDRKRQVSTGCRREDTDGAAKALEEYLSDRHTPTIGATDPRALAIADVITAYEAAQNPNSQDPREIARHDLLLIRLLDLNLFFGAKTVGDIKAQLCRDFVDWCTGTPNENNIKAEIAPRGRIVSDQTARRRLEDLRAAVNAYHAEHTLNFVPKISLPEKKEGRHRWLTRNEAARLLGAAIGFVWDVERGSWKRDERGPPGAAGALDYPKAHPGRPFHPGRALQRTPGGDNPANPVAADRHASMDELGRLDLSGPRR